MMSLNESGPLTLTGSAPGAKGHLAVPKSISKTVALSVVRHLLDSSAYEIVRQPLKTRVLQATRKLLRCCDQICWPLLWCVCYFCHLCFVFLRECRVARYRIADHALGIGCCPKLQSLASVLRGGTAIHYL